MNKNNGIYGAMLKNNIDMNKNIDDNKDLSLQECFKRLLKIDSEIHKNNQTVKKQISVILN